MVNESARREPSGVEIKSFMDVNDSGLSRGRSNRTLASHADANA